MRVKNYLLGSLLCGSFFISACGNDKPKEEPTAAKDSVAATAVLPADIATLAPVFTNIDAKVKAGIAEIMQHYYHVELALVNDNAAEAGNGGKAMVEAMAKLDKSAMTAEQKVLYEKNEEDLKEHAEHIQKSTAEITHQREHFEKMSEDVYELLKGFGSGTPVYKTFCPMAFDNKGAFWISKEQAVKNPYYGKSMLTCGEIKEVIK